MGLSAESYNMPEPGSYGYKSYLASQLFPVPVATPYFPTPGPFVHPPPFVPGLGYLEPCRYDGHGCARVDCCFYHPYEFSLPYAGDRERRTDGIQDTDWEVFWLHVIRHLEEGVEIIRQLFVAEWSRQHQIPNTAILGDQPMMAKILWESEKAYRTLFEREFPSRVQTKVIPRKRELRSKRGKIIFWNPSVGCFQVVIEDVYNNNRVVDVRPSLLVAFREQQKDSYEHVQDLTWHLQVCEATGKGCDIFIRRSMVEQRMKSSCDFWSSERTADNCLIRKGQASVARKDTAPKYSKSSQEVEETNSCENVDSVSKTVDKTINSQNDGTDSKSIDGHVSQQSHPRPPRMNTTDHSKNDVDTKRKAQAPQQNHRKPSLVSTKSVEKKNLKKSSETDQSRSTKETSRSPETYAFKCGGTKAKKAIKSAKQKHQNGNAFSGPPNVDAKRMSSTRTGDMPATKNKKLDDKEKPILSRAPEPPKEIASGNTEKELNQSPRNRDKAKLQTSEFRESDTCDERFDTDNKSPTKKEKKKKKRDKLKEKKQPQERDASVLKSEAGTGNHRSNFEKVCDENKQACKLSNDNVSPTVVGPDGSTSTFKTASPEIQSGTIDPTASVKLEGEGAEGSTDEGLAQADWNALADKAVASDPKSNHPRAGFHENSKPETTECENQDNTDKLFGSKRRTVRQGKKGQQHSSVRLDHETKRSERRDSKETKSSRKVPSKKPIHPQDCKCPQCQVSQANAVAAQQESVQRETYRQLLGVEETATSSEIRQAHRRLALQYHPDKFQAHRHEMTAVQAEVRFQEIQEAYECLTALAKDS
jgi:DnaJ-domain-containing protein 1